MKRLVEYAFLNIVRGVSNHARVECFDFRFGATFIKDFSALFKKLWRVDKKSEI